MKYRKGGAKNQATVKKFINRQQNKLLKDKDMDRELYADLREDSFAERFSKFSVRDFQNNTRMNIKNQDWAVQQHKRDRMVSYWQNQVLPNHLPHVDPRKRQEIIGIKQQNENDLGQNMTRNIKLNINPNSELG